MKNRVIQYIKENYMLQSGDKVIVAVSGGPDSICLLDILNEIKKDFNIELFAAHVNHCLRGKEADEDEQYVKYFCERIGVKFFSRKIDVQKYADEMGLSSELAGREVRYTFFDELKKEVGADKIALAHNANDQAETVLMRIMRGTGIEGLRGIRPVRDGLFIRPLLGITRTEIENYCKLKELNPRIDKTNLENIYNRNKIRLELIPYIQSNFNKDIIAVLNRLSEIISKDSEYLEELSEEKYRSFTEWEESRLIIHKAAFYEKEAMTTRIIRKCLAAIIGDLRNIESVHIYDILSLQKGTTGRQIILPRGITVENIYGDIYIQNQNNKINLNKKVPVKLIDKDNIEDFKTEYENFIDEMGINIKMRVITKNDKINFNRDGLTKYFDYDKINDGILVRTRKEGDRFIPYGMSGSRKLKDLFIDLKIPKDERDKIPLICFGEEIAWVVGYRISDKFKLTKDTSRVLEIKVRGEKKE